jgi:acyl-CoA dehydrogenase
MKLSTDDLPFFFTPRHHDLAVHLRAIAPELQGCIEARALAERMGSRLALYPHLFHEPADTRALCLIREALGQLSPLADSIFAVQGLGTHPLLLAGSPAQREQFLSDAAHGRRIWAFGLTESGAGSDVAALSTLASREGSEWVLNGEKTLISNVGIADFYMIFANTNPAIGKKGISAFIVPADAAGLSLSQIPLTMEHPLGKIRLHQCRLPDTALVGEVGDGLRLALATLGTFRVSVAAAACGMARHALEAATEHVKSRIQFGKPLAAQQLVQAQVAEMLVELDAARLLTFRAAWVKDHGERAVAEVAAAKLFATEAAFRIIDRAVQLFGGLGVTLGNPAEALLREIRPLRIYEGTSEIQKLILGEAWLK